MATTRIFRVEYNFVEEYDGKGGSTFKESKNVTAKNAGEAIAKVHSINTKSSTYFDEEKKKKVKVTRNHFDPINVTLEAEATREY
jgi:hypothetical protein